jgi:5-deoxy-D-glucuronate isomerase
LSGRCHVSTDKDEWKNIGGRESVFDGAPWAVYLPPLIPYRAEAVTERLELAIASAPAREWSRNSFARKTLKLRYRARGTLSERYTLS